MLLLFHGNHFLLNILYNKPVTTLGLFYEITCQFFGFKSSVQLPL